jgi:hypothetical protein
MTAAAKRRNNRELAAHSDEDREVYLPPPRKADFLSWDPDKGPAYSQAIRILRAPKTSRRGMRLIYGRGDHFGKLSCGLDMLLRKDGCLFVLFYSPGKRVTYRSYELVGLKLPPLPERGELLRDDCVPEVLRDLYEAWAVECIEYPDDID